MKCLVESVSINGASPLAYHYGGNPVADQVGEGARFAHETVYSQDQSQPRYRDMSHGR